MPCNAYGINDNYDLENSHFLRINKKNYRCKKKIINLLSYGEMENH